MLARAVDEIPRGAYAYEPKWDGFRAILTRGSDEVAIWSRAEKELTPYFPELVKECQRQWPAGTIMDGEIIVIRDDHLDFGLLQQRIHPAQSRVTLLSGQIPAEYVAFDLLRSKGQDLIAEPFIDRRRLLEDQFATLEHPFHLTALTDDRDKALTWFAEFEGAGLDGIVAKDWYMSYQPDVRAMLKIKHFRTAECVVAGYRTYSRNSDAVGALLLGLYDDDGGLHYVGSTSSFSERVRLEMAEILQPLVVATDHVWLDQNALRKPGAVSRWSAHRDRTFIALNPVLVCEVRYDQIEADRFRHTTRFLRWRPDRSAESCRYDQLDGPIRYQLSDVLR